jgi:hypothetical protein
MPIRAIATICTLLLLVTLAGCSTWQWNPAGSEPASAGPEQTAAPPDSIAGVLDFVGNALSLSRTERARVYRDARRSYASDRSATNRLRLAMLAALLPPPERNVESARALLTKYSWRTTRPGYSGIAAVTLEVIANERLAAGKIARVAKALKQARHDNAHLQKQLDALRAIEKSLNSRRLEGGDER